MGDRKLEKDAEGRGRSRGGKDGIYSRRESSEACARTPSLIGGPLNLRGQTAQLRLLLRTDLTGRH
jgi:hypothetical protein